MKHFQKGVADTSVFIAKEQQRTVRSGAIPDEIVVSVITIAELYAGVLIAGDVSSRSRRMTTLESLGSVEILDINERIARIWGELRVKLSEVGNRVNVNDLWIASTCISKNLPVITQDSDFDQIRKVSSLEIIKI